MGSIAQCKDPKAHREAGLWYAPSGQRYCNYSTFNGGRRTPSAYSEVYCGHPDCGQWRTKAKYVATLPTEPKTRS